LEASLRRGLTANATEVELTGFTSKSSNLITWKRQKDLGRSTEQIRGDHQIRYDQIIQIWIATIIDLFECRKNQHFLAVLKSWTYLPVFLGIPNFFIIINPMMAYIRGLGTRNSQHSPAGCGH
jgi:hypothetical protein